MLPIFRPALALALCALLACPPMPAQDPKNPQHAPTDKQDLIKPDPKQAKRLVEAGEKMEQAGNLEQEILQLCRGALARHKVPAAIHFVSNLALAASGKMVRHQCAM